MKHFSKLTCVIVASIVLGLGFAGCAEESEAERESIASATAIISTEPTAIESIAETTVEFISEIAEVSSSGVRVDGWHGVYTYKGFEFEGFFSESDYYVFFDVDDEALHGEAGQSILQVAYDATLAFISADCDRLLEYFSEEDAEEQKTLMERFYTTDFSERLVDLGLQRVYFVDVKDNPDYPKLFVTYIGAFDEKEWYLETYGSLEGYDENPIELYLFILINMKLTDDGEWKVCYIEY